MKGHQIVLAQSRELRRSADAEFTRQSERLGQLAEALHWSGPALWALGVFVAGFAAGWFVRGAP